MPQSMSQIWLHLIFSTKDRQIFLQNTDFRQEMFRALSHQVQEIGCLPKCVGGWVDHVHVVCSLTPSVTIANLIQHLKTETSKWSKKGPNGAAMLSWQTGYGAFSVSPSNLDRVIDYVERQAEHHKRQSYQDEFRLLCRKHEIEIDERYVWD